MPDGRKLIPQERLAELRELAEYGGPQPGVLFEMDNEEFLRLLDHVAMLQESLDEEGGFCEVCGCSFHNPCESGCWWEAPGLCSSCRYQVELADDDEGWQVQDVLEGVVLGDESGALIYQDLKIAKRVAEAGRLLYQVVTCSCGWEGLSIDVEESGRCPLCHCSGGLFYSSNYEERPVPDPLPELDGSSPRSPDRGEDSSPLRADELPTGPPTAHEELPMPAVTAPHPGVGSESAGLGALEDASSNSRTP